MRRILPDRPLTDAERQKRYRAARKGVIAARVSADRTANPQKYAAYKRAWLSRKGRATRMLQFARARSKAKGLEFSLTAEHIVIPEVCPVLGIALTHSIEGFCDNSPTIDRVDNGRGYTPDNIVIVSWRANRIKADATPEELTKVAAFYAAWRAS